MKFIFIILCILFSSCDKRKCECLDDLYISWQNNTIPDSTYLEFPNAILHQGENALFKISSTENIDWSNQYAKFYKDDQVFIDATDLTKFINYTNILEFPNELFQDENGDFVRGATSVEITIDFPDKQTSLTIDGSLYYYTCNDLDDFHQEECR